MIIKNYELNKNSISGKNFFLFYGNNEGLKNEIIKKNFSDNKIINFDEKEVLENEKNFIDNILSKSLFEENKTVVIKRSSDKICKIIEKIKEKNIENDILIFISDNLEKKSKLRNLFEKEIKFVCIPFYPDTEQTLIKLAHEFLRKKKISLSSENINLLINKIGGSREFLYNELRKIEYFCLNGKKITTLNLLKLLNLAQNHSTSDIADNYLAGNKRKIIDILNDNTFTNEDCVHITRSLLIKSKKILKLSTDFKVNKDLDLTINSAKPPIFWKDKEIIKRQVFKWKPENLKIIIYKLNEIETLIKKNVNLSVNLITNFLLEQSYLNDQ